MKTYIFIGCRLLLLPLFILLLGGCEDYLDVKPDKALVVPGSLSEFQALLDNDRQIMNQDIALGFIGAGNYYLPDAAWQGLYTAAERNGYTWAEDIFEGETPYDWNQAYEQVFYANVVLDGLQDIPQTAANRQEWEGIRGQALFYRSNAFYGLLQHFAAPYQAGTAPDMPGIPLRLTSDITAPSGRASLEASYAEVTGSLQEAVRLLPENSAYKTRPDKAAAYGLLARVYLSMEVYGLAESYADSSLALHNSLIDYNSLDPEAAVPFALFNEEVVYHSVLMSYGIRSRALLKQELYESYAEEDLRRQLYFMQNMDGTYSFKGWYSGSNALFSGLATDELLLIRGESRARQGDVSGAMEDLNRLLVNRWQSGTFEPFTAANAQEALDLILQERRKELLFRGLRWSDLRRLNRDERYAETLERSLMGETYTLPPNSPRWVYPIPQQEIDLSGISQNPR